MAARDLVQADQELKARHRAMWASGDYPEVAARVIPDLGAELVRACGVGPAQRVLDVAAGSGNAAIPAALAGASVVASDLTPELLEAGRLRAAEAGASVRWEVADAEALPFRDGEFDTVLSCVGVMFAPRHQASADELVRVVRPGGTIGVLSWTPEGFVGQMLGATRPYVPQPPPGVQPPVLWGRPEHVRGLFGDRVGELRARRAAVRVDCFATPEEFRDFFSAAYGPTRAAYRGLAGEPERSAALDRDLVDLARRHDLAPGSGRLVMDWEYLLVTAAKRS
jgi:SAM-dependent methyltransferase